MSVSWSLSSIEDNAIPVVICRKIKFTGARSPREQRAILLTVWQGIPAVTPEMDTGWNALLIEIRMWAFIIYNHMVPCSEYAQLQVKHIAHIKFSDIWSNMMLPSCNYVGILLIYHALMCLNGFQKYIKYMMCAGAASNVHHFFMLVSRCVSQSIAYSNFMWHNFFSNNVMMWWSVR